MLGRLSRFAEPETVVFRDGENYRKMIRVDLLGFMIVRKVTYLPNVNGQPVYPSHFKRIECL